MNIWKLTSMQNKNIFNYWRYEIYYTTTIIIIILVIFKLKDETISRLSAKLLLTLGLRNKNSSNSHLFKYKLAKFLTWIIRYT